MTAETIIDSAKLMLGYVGQASRDPIADLVGMVNDGIRDLIDMRPHVLLQTDGTFTTFTDITVDNYTSEELPIDDQYRVPIAHYVASRIFANDGGDEHNAGLAEHHRSQYRELT